MPFQARIAVVGSINPEIMTGRISEMPAWGTQVRCPHTHVVYAGSAFRVTVPLKNLGHSASVFGVVGGDDFGTACLSELQSRGMGVSEVERFWDEQTGSLISVVREDGQRMFFSHIGAHERLDVGYLERHLSELAQHEFVLLTGLFGFVNMSAIGLRRVFAQLRAQGVTTLLDTGWHLGGWPDETLRDLHELLTETDYVLPNLDEIRRMTCQDGNPSQLARALRDAGARNVFLKMGDRGAACLVGEEFSTSPPVQIRALNTTAAGECFNAGVLHGIATGLPPGKTLDLANSLAAHYVATGRYVTLDEIAVADKPAVPTALGTTVLDAG